MHNAIFVQLSYELVWLKCPTGRPREQASAGGKTTLRVSAFHQHANHLHRQPPCQLTDTAQIHGTCPPEVKIVIILGVYGLARGLRASE